MSDMNYEEKTFILHDIKNMDNSDLFTDGKTHQFYTGNKYAFCKGCFDCWLKTPGVCILRDSVFGLANHLSDCSTFVIVSKLLYGGFSTCVKGVTDRLIAFNLPYFKKLNGELHHIPRYDNQFKMRVFFYGEATDNEKETAEEYVSRIALNLNNEDYKTVFLKDESEWRKIYENIACGL